ncbi:MAG TPA: M23 family metallopeptidase [Halanaerobiales bacterium]|nr:M23 family metallopeptidase [Halanaerobiales bacterium]
MNRTHIFSMFLILIISVALIMSSNLILSNERIRTTNTYETELKYTRVNEFYNQKHYKNDDEFIFDIKIRNYYLREHNVDPCLMEQFEFHIVQNGETLWSIAQKHGINIDTLIGANNIDNMNRIKPGDSLLILPVKGILYKIGPGQSIEGLAENFNIEVSTIRTSNNIGSNAEVQTGRLVLLPGAKPEFGYKDRLEKMLIAPVNARISSYYGRRWGRMHEGVDYAVNIGTPIRAAGAGRVVFSGWSSGYGKAVIIEHRKGLRTLYAHNSQLLVHVGQYVERNEVISKSGNTGRSTGPHLHFEVQINSRAVNPLNYLR